MDRYVVVGGVAKIGAGETLELSGEQIRSRLHQLELPEGYEFAAKNKKSKPAPLEAAIVTSKEPLEFIVGEEIGFPSPVPMYLAAFLKPTSELAEAGDASQVAFPSKSASKKSGKR